MSNNVEGVTPMARGETEGTGIEDRTKRMFGEGGAKNDWIARSGMRAIEGAVMIAIQRINTR